MFFLPLSDCVVSPYFFYFNFKQSFRVCVFTNSISYALQFAMFRIRSTLVPLLYEKRNRRAAKFASPVSLLSAQSSPMSLMSGVRSLEAAIHTPSNTSLTPPLTLSLISDTSSTSLFPLYDSSSSRSNPTLNSGLSIMKQV